MCGNPWNIQMSIEIYKCAKMAIFKNFMLTFGIGIFGNLQKSLTILGSQRMHLQFFIICGNLFGNPQ